MVMGSSLGELILILYFFWHFGFDLNMERWKGNPREAGSQRGLERQP